ncbi:hypothetical protein WJX84_001459 [Apatococcus fuscideae]|uniref:ADP-ribosylglycohydrolase n=1 Tax=Apatococcus fuscideae TaxID=2026836 RepID=A0AAW1RM13_9CHLO
MPGGGCLQLGRGQFTDDTELALSLAAGLLLHENDSQTFPAEHVAQQYRRWIQSEPFDVGMATTNAFGSANPSGPSGAAKMMEEASWKNQDSKANGALMRIAPLAIFGCYLPLPSLTAMAEQDARLSHPNKTCLSCNAAYCAALGHLIAHPGDAPGAIAVATAVAERPDFEPEVRQWLVVDSLGEPAGLNCEQMIGFCRWGFTLAFMWLRKGSRGGDTDTNAAIVGGLMGALWGAKAIPDSMSGPVLGSAWWRTSQDLLSPFRLQVRKPHVLYHKWNAAAVPVRLPEFSKDTFWCACPKMSRRRGS